MKQLSSATILAFVLCFAATATFAQDNASSRQAAADRYLKVVPMSKMLDDAYAEIAKQVPQDQRAQVVAQMKEIVRVDVLERITRDSMVNTFTTDELNALANFYGSPNGASAMKKFGIYMGQVIPAIQQEIQRAIQQLNTQQKK